MAIFNWDFANAKIINKGIHLDHSASNNFLLILVRYSSSNTITELFLNIVHLVVIIIKIVANLLMRILSKILWELWAYYSSHSNYFVMKDIIDNFIYYSLLEVLILFNK